jgi:hypothetical protein
MHCKTARKYQLIKCIAILYLKAWKTEPIWFGSRQNLATEPPPSGLILNIESGVIHSVNVVGDLGFLLDTACSFNKTYEHSELMTS